MIRGVHHIGLHTPDLDRLRAFYAAAFDFQQVGDETRLEDLPAAAWVVGVPEPAARVVMLRARNCLLELFEWSRPRPDPAAAPRAYDLGYTHLCVDVIDIDGEYGRLAALGMRFAHPAPVHFGALASVYGYDPDGNIIEIAEIPRGSELHLALDGATPVTP